MGQIVLDLSCSFSGFFFQKIVVEFQEENKSLLNTENSNISFCMSKMQGGRLSHQKPKAQAQLLA